MKVHVMTGASRLQDFQAMAFAVEGTWAELPARITDRCADLHGHDANLVLDSAGGTAAQSGDTFEKFGAVAREVTQS